MDTIWNHDTNPFENVPLVTRTGGMNSCPPDEIHAQNSYQLLSPPSELNNSADQLLPSYEFTLQQATSSTGPASSEPVSAAPALNQFKLEDAHRVLDYADYAWEKQNWAKAQTHYTTAATIFRIVEDSRNEAHCLQRLGETCRMLRQFRAARAHVLQAHILFGQYGEIARQLMCERWLARTTSDEGNSEEARLILRAALDSSRSSGLRESEGWSLLRLGEINGVDKNLIQQALDIAREEKLPLLETRCLIASHWKKPTGSQPELSTGKATGAENDKATSKEKAHGTLAPDPQQITGASGSKQKDVTPERAQGSNVLSRWFKRCTRMMRSTRE
ncbi:hypothetical protein FRC08_016831 [Ceratobasidium sp. 394]|nr:hypothetical protein FRC08_016831 [Ceratobasidium sp. 394]KAG9096788.1 hypothetical protein FS749_007725 [Ceratobasidium sp. UAMH 11750]